MIIRGFIGVISWHDVEGSMCSVRCLGLGCTTVVRIPESRGRQQARLAVQVLPESFHAKDYILALPRRSYACGAHVSYGCPRTSPGCSGNAESRGCGHSAHDSIVTLGNLAYHLPGTIQTSRI